MGSNTLTCHGKLCDHTLSDELAYPRNERNKVLANRSLMAVGHSHDVDTCFWPVGWRTEQGWLAHRASLVGDRQKLSASDLAIGLGIWNQSER